VVNSSGTPIARYEYDPYGWIANSFGNAEIKHLFTGQEQEKDFSSSSLWNFRAREFDSEVGLFYAVDPSRQTHSPFGYCGGNPIIYIDPTGRAYYYSSEGNYFGTDGVDDDLVYITNQENVKNNTDNYKNTNWKNVVGNRGTSKLGIGYKELLKLAATSYGEAKWTNVYKEMAGISSVIVRKAKDNDVSISKLLSTRDFAKAVEKERYMQFDRKSNDERESDVGMKTAIKGAINAATGGPDYSNGAYFWDGADLGTEGVNHYKMKDGFLFTNPNHDIYNVGSNAVEQKEYWEDVEGNRIKQRGKTFYYTYESTAAHGGTVFSKYTRLRLIATGGKAWK